VIHTNYPDNGKIKRNQSVSLKSPDRPNMFLEIVKKKSTEYETCLSWLIEHIRVKGSNSKKTIIYSPRFLCRPTALYIFARAVGRQRAIHTENSGFASPTLGRRISTFRGYRILFSIRNPYINRFTNHFSIHS
jgi:hypothetical protein